MSRRRPVRVPRRSSVHLPQRGAAAYRRLLARHPWIHWLVVACLAVTTAAQVLARDDRIAQARDAWGATRAVLVVERATAPGDPIVASMRDVPVAMVPDAAIEAPTGSNGIGYTARQHLAPGEIVTTVDVAGEDGAGPLPLLPAGWLALPIVESPPSGAAAGDRVQLASGGLVVADDALVVGRLDDVTLIGVPAREAAALPPAADSGGLVVLRRP